MELIKPGTKFQFTRYRKIAFVLSTVLNVAVLLALFIKGPNLGVDFAGGTMVHLKFAQAVTIAEIRRALDRVNLAGGVVQDFGEPGQNEFLIRLDKTSVELGALGEQVRKGLVEQFGAEKFEVRRIESVGPQIGEELRFRGTMSVIVATIMMGIYIWIRFGSAFGAKFGLLFGTGAVVALIHDVLITVGALRPPFWPRTPVANCSPLDHPLAGSWQAAQLTVLSIDSRGSK